LTMSKHQLTVARVNDAVLGSLGTRIPQSELLDHAVRYLSTWNGSDKLFMIIQYAAKLLIPLLRVRARLQFRAGMRPKPEASSVAAFSRLAATVGDARMLWRLWGILPIIQWFNSLERSQPPTRNLLTIERLQAWSMLAYYPLEHVYWLASHSLLPWNIPARTLDKISRWSCRFWAAYVILQFLHLREDALLIAARERTLRQDKGKTSTSKEGEADTTDKRWADIAQRKAAIRNEALINGAYLPLTLHWSIDGGLFREEAWVGLFGFVAGIASFRGGWEATRK